MEKKKDLVEIGGVKDSSSVSNEETVQNLQTDVHEDIATADSEYEQGFSKRDACEVFESFISEKSKELLDGDDVELFAFDLFEFLLFKHFLKQIDPNMRKKISIVGRRRMSNGYYIREFGRPELAHREFELGDLEYNEPRCMDRAVRKIPIPRSILERFNQQLLKSKKRWVELSPGMRTCLISDSPGKKHNETVEEFIEAGGDFKVYGEMGPLRKYLLSCEDLDQVNFPKLQHYPFPLGKAIRALYVEGAAECFRPAKNIEELKGNWAAIVYDNNIHFIRFEEYTDSEYPLITITDERDGSSNWPWKKKHHERSFLKDYGIDPDAAFYVEEKNKGEDFNIGWFSNISWTRYENPSHRIRHGWRAAFRKAILIIEP